MQVLCSLKQPLTGRTYLSYVMIAMIAAESASAQPQRADEPQLVARLTSMLQSRADEVTSMRVECDIFRAANSAISGEELERLLMEGFAAGSAEDIKRTFHDKLDAGRRRA